MSSPSPTPTAEPGSTLAVLSDLLDTMSISKSKNASDGTGSVPFSAGKQLAASPHQQPAFATLYDMDLRLRSGSYGTVFTCKHKLHKDTTYAVKVMDRQKLKSSDLDSVCREVRILNELTQARHPEAPFHVVELIDFFVEPKSLYMVQVYAHGGDVFDRVSSRRQYTEKDARELALHLLETVHFLHSRPTMIVHRDLKPENLLLLDSVNDASILLADFGFARHLKPDEKATTRCGTPAYVAPEIVLGLPYTATVDLWSVGCLLFFLVAGSPPFEAPHHRALFRKIRAGDFVFNEKSWKNVSLPAKQLISHLLTVNAGKRWTAEQALSCDWFRKSKLDQLEKHDLSGNLEELKKFRPKDAWRRAVNALGFCSTAPFWNPDAISFSHQLSTWDKSVTSNSSAASSTTTNVITNSTMMLINKLPRMKFADRYELKKQLRKGSHAVVWECVPKGEGADSIKLACKVIQRKGLKPMDDETVLNEVAVMQSLQGNKYVVQLLDFYEEEEYFYLVMEFCAGGDVFDRVVQYTHYTESDARDLAKMLLKAVYSIHKGGIAHRDIKPQNLLLISDTDHATIKVADFGFARRVHTPESLTNRVGTPTYVAPEILKNVPHDERVDLWSVGVVIFVLLVGYPPFLDQNQSKLFHKIRSGEWEFIEEDWKHISNDAKDLIKGLLVVDPADRLSIGDCLRSAWIREDEINLSTDLTESLRTLRTEKSRLRSMARVFKGVGDKTEAADVATQAQLSITESLPSPGGSAK